MDTPIDMTQLGLAGIFLVAVAVLYRDSKNERKEYRDAIEHNTQVIALLSENVKENTALITKMFYFTKVGKNE